MDLWSVTFETARPMAAFPRLQRVAGERQVDSRYRNEGRFRASEQHCLFKFSLRGCGTFRDARGEHRVPAGYGFLCEIRDPATAYYHPGNGAPPWEFVYLCFIGPTATAMTREFIARHGPVHALPADHGFVASLLAWRNQAGRCLNLTPAAGARIVAELFDALTASRAEPAEPGPGAELVRRAIERVRSQAGRDLNATQLARALSVSREHLTRVFRQETAWTPYTFILRERIQEACRLLKDTNLPNKEVAARIGYDTAPHFNRAFRRVMHMSPLQFRKVGTLPVH